MRKVIILMFIIGSWNSMKCQEGSTQDWSKEDQKIFEAGTELFNKHYYQSAYEKYVSLDKNHPNDLFLKFVRGVCAVYINNKHKEAEKLLLEVKKNNSNAENIDYYLALLFHKSYRFDKALELTNGLLSNPNLSKEDRFDLERIAFFSTNGKKEIQYPFETIIEPLGTQLNTEYAEYAPVISPEEEAIIYTYRGKGSVGGLVNASNKPDPNGDYNEDIFVSQKINDVWQKGTGLTELNTIGNDAAIALSPDGKQLFIFKVTGENGDIYVSNREGNKYSPAVRLAGEVNSDYWEGSLSMSTDQQKLFFASTRPGGFGGKDLYVATKKEDGTWGNVKNLGNKINTQYDEDAPFISPDGRTLIFSSEGHNSIGDFDLFTSDLNLTDGSWKEPKNLGYPVNTTDDDLFYVLSPDGKRGYFSSAREGGKGDQDIYVVEPALSTRKNYITIIKGKVTQDNLPFETEITVGVAGESKSYGSYRSSAASGNYVINLPTGKNYKLSFTHPTLGEKVYNIHTEQVEDYAERNLNVNFNTKDKVKNSPVTINVSKADSAKAAIAQTKTTTVVNTPTTSTLVANTSENKITEKGSLKPETVAAKNNIGPKKKNRIDQNTKTETANLIEEPAAKTKTAKEKTISENPGDCDDIKTDHDGDFDYKKCNTVWYTKSKANPVSSYAREKAKDWTSLSDNAVANERLNKRYP